MQQQQILGGYMAIKGSAAKVDSVELVRRETLKSLPVTEQERVFCESYVRHFDKWMAFKEAGFKVSKKVDGAGYQGRVLENDIDEILSRSHVQAYLRVLKESVATRVGVTIDGIVDEYKAMAFAKMTDYVTWDSGGLTFVRSSKELSDAQVRGVMEVMETDTKHGKQVKVKLFPKQPALDRLFDILKELESIEAPGEERGIKVKNQINMILADPAMRRSVEVLTEGLFGKRVMLSATDPNKEEFDLVMQNISQRYLEKSHGGEATEGVSDKSQTKARVGKGGRGKEEGFSRHQEAEDAGGAEQGLSDAEACRPGKCGVYGQAVGGRDDGEEEEVAESRYDIDGL